MKGKKIVLSLVLGLLFIVVLLTACGGEQAQVVGPDDTVHQFMEAFQQGNSDALSGLLSQQGRANAAAYCAGAVSNCLASNYPAGELEVVAVEIVEQSEYTATVQLRVSTGSGQAQQEKCQDYQIENTDDGDWLIAFFGPPQPCTEGKME